MPKSPTDHKPKTAARNYGWDATDSDLMDLDLPSGAVVQVRRPDPARLIAAGLLDEFDGFTAVVAGDTVPRAEGDGGPAAAPQSLKAVARQLAAFDRVLAEVVVQPTVVLDRAGAVDGAVWAGQVALDDKTFVVQHAMGGTSSLEAFRAGPAGALAGAPVGT